MRKISDAEIKRQIARFGGRFGVVAMDSVYGGVLAAEDIPVKIPCGGLSALTRIRRDITAINSNCPWARFLHSRKRKGERSFALRLELANAARIAAHKARIDDAMHELAGDIRRADRGRLVFQG